ncbi:hypothetical protein ACNQFN_22395 [Thauera butanivorans]|uniref:hypothetical protein n=1 Tax=Thauera butanivorans TaxID=86174 RepID=UPI003AB5154F
MTKTMRPQRRFRRTAQSGAIKPWMLIVLLLALAPLLTLGFYEGRKAYWDAKVREMCEIDGGVKINEVIDVDENSYESIKNKFGQVDFPKKGTPESKDSVAVYSYKDTYIRRGAPEVRRSDLIVSRTSNGSILATSTTYSRVGGDLFALHPSHFSCPNTPNNFFASVINIKGKAK